MSRSLPERGGLVDRGSTRLQPLINKMYTAALTIPISHLLARRSNIMRRVLRDFDITLRGRPRRDICIGAEIHATPVFATDRHNL